MSQCVTLRGALSHFAQGLPCGWRLLASEAVTVGVTCCCVCSLDDSPMCQCLCGCDSACIVPGHCSLGSL